MRFYPEDLSEGGGPFIDEEDEQAQLDDIEPEEQTDPEPITSLAPMTLEEAQDRLTPKGTRYGDLSDEELHKLAEISGQHYDKPGYSDLPFFFRHRFSPFIRFPRCSRRQRNRCTRRPSLLVRAFSKSPTDVFDSLTTDSHPANIRLGRPLASRTLPLLCVAKDNARRD